MKKRLQIWQFESGCIWWRHQMETFSALLALCAGNSPVTGEFPAQSPVTRSFDVSFDLNLNKRLSKQSLGWWFQTPSRPLWRHRNVHLISIKYSSLRQNMMTSSNGNSFRVTGHLCGYFTGHGEFPTQRPVTRNFGVFFDLRLHKLLSNQWRSWWFETPSRP